jgi:lycopene cyclase domain-containing protein
MLGTLVFPLALSFDKKVHFFKRWKYLLPSLILPAAIFIVWDVVFTEQGIWHFNPDYVTGIYILNLPVEEWLFFLVVPYACVFIYDVVKYYWPRINNVYQSRWLGFLLMLASLVTVFVFHDRTYTLLVAIFLFVTLLAQFFTHSSEDYLFRFFVAYLICLVPFAIVNGILTALPVVVYNDLENINHRIGTIPVEDTLYFLTLFLMNVTLYEYLIRASSRRKIVVKESVSYN